MAVFLLSCSALLFQVAQTRLFSATLGYHLTNLASRFTLRYGPAPRRAVAFGDGLLGVSGAPQPRP